MIRTIKTLPSVRLHAGLGGIFNQFNNLLKADQHLIFQTGLAKTTEGIGRLFFVVLWR